jgi:hypothetical protein
VDDYIEVGNISLFNFDASKSFSVTLWRRSDDPNPSATMISKKYDHGLTTGWVILQDNNSGRNIAARLADGTNLVVLDAGSFNTLDWRFVVLVVNRNANRAMLYVDGSLKAGPTDISAVGSFVNTQSLSMGRVGSGVYWLDLLDEVRLYNRALSDAEIQALYNATK